MSETTNNPPLRILVVEDFMLMVEQVGEILDRTSLQLETKIARTDVDALALIEKFEPEVVLLDLMLKKGDGFAVLKQLQRRTSKPLVIVMTNFALPNYRYYAKLAGADHFLDKSEDLEQIKTIVQAFERKRKTSSRPPEKSHLKFLGLYSVRI